MKTALLIFIYVTYISSEVRAEGARAISNILEQSDVFRSVANGREEIRLDAQGDNTADAIRVKQGNVTTDIYNVDGTQKVLIEKKDVDESTFVSGIVENQQFDVQSVTKVKNSKSALAGASTFNKSEICSKIQSNLDRYKAGDFSNLSKRQIQVQVDQLLDASCGGDIPRLSYSKFLSSYYSSVLGLSNEKSCLEKIVNEAKVAYREKRISEEEMLRYQLAFSEAKAEAADLLEVEKPRPIFQCEKGEQSNCSLLQDGSVMLKHASTPNERSLNSTMLQKVGVPGDTDKITMDCENNKAIFGSRKAKSIKDEGHAINLTNMSVYSSVFAVESDSAVGKSTVELSKKEVAPINKDLAQTKMVIPTPAEASPKALAKIEATQGPAAVQQVMRQQSSGILNMTNAVMAAVNTQAVAGTKTATREVASTGSGSGSGSSSKKSSNISGFKKTTIGKDETVVEQYLVDEPSAGTKTRTVANVGSQGAKSAASLAANGNSRKPANVDEATGGSGELAGGTGGGGGSSAGGAGRGSSFSPSSGGTKNNSAATAGGQGRPTASATSSSASDEVSGDELVSFIKNSEYASTKLKIQKDNKFRNQLKVNGITIIDKAGNFIVPGDNKVIFMDKGNRFEKQ